ncbi:MAG: hypothetical protein K0Q95_1147 [Bacteroidota bacterium]|jgi:hypothetical protein|nr:hypothetical protein [Bacteroidota bacterium]
MQRTNLNDSIISKNINNHIAFRCYQDTRNELKTKPGFNDSLYNNIYHSYHFKDNYDMNNAEFKNKCIDFQTKVKNKWR